jgi:hypothetical protein
MSCEYGIYACAFYILNGHQHNIDYCWHAHGITMSLCLGGCIPVDAPVFVAVQKGHPAAGITGCPGKHTMALTVGFVV